MRGLHIDQGLIMATKGGYAVNVFYDSTDGAKPRTLKPAGRKVLNILVSEKTNVILQVR